MFQNYVIRCLPVEVGWTPRARQWTCTRTGRPEQYPCVPMCYVQSVQQNIAKHMDEQLQWLSNLKHSLAIFGWLYLEWELKLQHLKTCDRMQRDFELKAVANQHFQPSFYGWPYLSWPQTCTLLWDASGMAAVAKVCMVPRSFAQNQDHSELTNNINNASQRLIWQTCESYQDELAAWRAKAWNLPTILSQRWYHSRGPGCVKRCDDQALATKAENAGRSCRTLHLFWARFAEHSQWTGRTKRL